LFSREDNNMGFMDDYVDVAERIRMFREKYPNGSLQQVSLQFIDFAGKSWVVYTAAAYRSPDDITPGHGTAWEPVPGTSSFKRDSEVMNAETSAWGRAIIAVLVADGGKRIASKQEVQAKAPATPLEDFIGLAHLEFEKGDIEALRGVYKRAKATRGVTPELLKQIEDLAKGLKK
jgi:hypothetical protein